MKKSLVLAMAMAHMQLTRLATYRPATGLMMQLTNWLQKAL